MSDGSVAVFIAKTRGDAKGGAFAELAIIGNEKKGDYHYSVPKENLNNTDVIFEINYARSAVRVRFPGANYIVCWSIKSKEFDLTNSADGPFHTIVELVGINWGVN